MVLTRRFALERRGEETLPGYQHDGEKRDSLEDIALVVHRKTPLPPGKWAFDGSDWRPSTGLVNFVHISTAFPISKSAAGLCRKRSVPPTRSASILIEE